MMLASQMCILRVFGLPGADVAAAVRAAEAEGCPGLRLLERDGEYAVCIQVSAPTQAMADEYCEKWAQKVRARLGDAVYGTGETSLAQVTLDALLKKRRLLVAADAVTGRLIGALLQPLEHSEAAYDFGNQTWADPAKARKIVTPPQLMQRFPGDVLQAAAGRAQIALAMAGADYAVVYLPATVGQAPSVLLCDKRGALAQAIGPDTPDAAIANHLLDLVRRRALGLRLSPAAIAFRPGHERPLLIVSQDGQPQAGGTGRFSLRRRPARAPEPVREPAPEPAVDGQPTGVIVFENDAGPQKPQSAPQAAPAEPAPGEEEPFAPLPDPLDFQTAGPQAAEASRAARSGRSIRRAAPQAAPAAVPAQPEEAAPAPSLLDGDIPDFSAGLDPVAMAAARAADDKLPPHSTEDLEQAASRLFELPDLSAPGKKAARSAKKDGGQPAAAADHGAVSIKNRSLAVIERSERRRRRKALIMLLVELLVLAAIGGGIWLWRRGDLGARPAPRNYGTEVFDTTAANYLGNARQKLEDVAGYIAFPGIDGQFVYTQPSAGADGAAAHGVCFAGENWLGSAAPSNTTLRFTNSLADV